MKEYSDRKDLVSTGIYLLIGKNEEGEDMVYLGEAENIYSRINQHLSQKDFWNETIVFVSKDDNLNKAHIKYLENRLFEIATTVDRYKLANNNIPTQSAISESDKAEMEEFIDNLKILVNTLGHKIFEGKREIKSENSKEIQEFTLSNPRENSNATGIPTSEGFVVFKGSKISESMTPKIPEGLKKLREKLISLDTLKLIDSNYVFQKDYIFNSPSAAAGVVLGRSANGLTEWRANSGLNLKDFETH
ncbi:GIY-YIG nuclease family protein [Lacihabitans sp. LS3-19]|uniref:GIY-YIG nuclease family protein n=1 Tax=Lacihabitans sp. LS3-19 TaxID=2487335 RepID=UPI0020CE42B1|nr:GIY-YIG nuclease family protein [Lacihabitans sp. LS3-19]